MKNLFYLVLSAMFLLPAHLLAQDTFYVSSTGRNSNPGTQEEPWGALNAEQLTDKCTVIVMDEVYLDPVLGLEDSDGLTEITIQGGSPEAALMALNDEEFEDGELNTSYFFDIKGVKLNLKDITLKNMNRETGNGAGGMIYMNAYAELVLENVIMKNSVVDVGLNCRGGAIWCEGKLTAINSTFENCKAFQGGAIYLKETEEPVVARFETCVFANNQTVNGNAAEGGSGAAGGAMYIEGKELDVTFDKCYFDSNYAWNTNGNANGGVMRLQTLEECDANITFTSCTIANNKSRGSSGFMQWARPDEGNINLRFINNVMYKNRTEGPQANLMTAQKSYITPELSGSFVFVNNTSIMNNTGADELVLSDQTTINFSDFGGDFDFVLINNIMLDCMTEGILVEDNIVDQLGYGWAIREATGRTTGEYFIKNNVHDGVGGSYDDTWGEGFLYHFLNDDVATANNNKNIRGKSVDQKLEQLGIAGTLTKKDDEIIPYIIINDEDGYAIDNGVSSFIYKGEEIIPQTDIRGAAIKGASRDLGAYEYNETIDAIKELLGLPEVLVYFNAADNKLYFSEEVALVKIYSVSGTCVLSANNVNSLNVSSISGGIYLVQTVNKDGKTYTRKIRK